MHRERLQLALERLPPEQWKRFEEFASEFLAILDPNHRTVASPSGDGGRDAQLFSPDGQVKIVFQYSVTKKWESKIRETAKRISETFPKTRILRYVTNQSILSAADTLKTEILDNHDLVLDIYDRHWFLERLNVDEGLEAAAESLAKLIVDPYLAGKEVLKHSAPTLSTTEYQAALTFLQLQREDDIREKGLTRLSFEALVRAVLRNSHSEARVSRTVIHDHIRKMLPSHDRVRVSELVDSALGRLTKRSIRHWTKDDEFCLTATEAERVRERLAEIEVANTTLDSEILSTLQGYDCGPVETELLCELTRAAINRYLFDRGEAFVDAITNNKLETLGPDELQHSIEYVTNSELTDCTPKDKQHAGKVILMSMIDLFTEPSKEVQSHLRSKADAYTLLAFLGQTPDAQAAVSKMFSHGSIWLDTTIVLPIFAEQLMANGYGRFTQMLKIASSAGLNLRITSGVIEEVERHMNRCLAYVHTGHAEWVGRIPFLIDAYMRSGRDPMSFASWIEYFRGHERPEDDLAEYLAEFFSIAREDLEEDEKKAADHVRFAVQETWHELHTKRRNTHLSDLDEITVQRLVKHDVENYLGVAERRRNEDASPFGYSAWWLTLDRVAFEVDKRIMKTLKNDAPSTPVMSADFLVNYLSIGPIRSQITKSTESILPVVLDVGMLNELPPDLLDEAERIRREASDLPEHVVRRRVRDYLDAAKRQRGRIVDEGVQPVLDDISRDANSD